MVSSTRLHNHKFNVYMFTFPSGKSYIGRTCDFTRRLRNHLEKSSGCIYVRNCFKKFGISNVDITILKSGLQGAYLANQWEKFFIATFDTLAPNGLNLTPGGDGVCYTQEIRDKISKALKGRKLSKEHRKTLSIVGKKRWEMYPMTEYTRNKIRNINLGKKFSKEHCKNISKARKVLGIRLTEEQKQHLRNINLGKKMSEEAVRKAVETRIANGNHLHSEETKMKIGDANRGKVRTDEHRKKMSIAHKNSTFDWSTTRKYKDEEILKVFNECDKDRNKTASILNIHYNTVFRCLKRNNLTR